LLRLRGKQAWATGGIAAAGVAITVGATVLAGTTSAVNAGGSGGGEKVLMAAMQRDLSLTAEQSTARLKKENWASGTESTLREKLGTKFGGAWMANNTLMVGVTTRAAAKTVREAGATPKLVDQAEWQLTAVKKTLDTTKAANSKITGWYVDPKTNSVVVVAQPGGKAAARQLIAAGDVSADSVRVVVAAGKPKLLADIRGADPYIINEQFRCSIGFSVVGGFVTAGHCGVPGDTTADVNNVAQGVVKASVFPGTGDFGFVETNADQVLQPVVATSDGIVNVAGSEEAPIGAAICRSGSTTGTKCGVIQAKNATVNYPEGTVTGLTQTDVCAEGGDSGGPWLSGEQAQGVTSGGSGDCTVGGTTFFQPLTEILEVNKLQLLTTENAAPPATDPAATDPAATDPAATDPAATDPAATDPAATDPAATDPAATEPPATEPPAVDPPAADCPDVDATVKSSLRRSGAAQAAPVDGFETAGGNIQACLTGPDDADFDLSLQKFVGDSWRTVSKAQGDASQEVLTFDAPAGRYRVAVSSFKGSGDYKLAIDVP
jgi:streptogrisin C